MLDDERVLERVMSHGINVIRKMKHLAVDGS